MSKPVLQIENLSKNYMLGKREVSALKNLNLTVNAGEFVAIMGPSGSGKTTLLNVIGCIDKPTSGQVLLDGIDVGKMPENQLYKIRRDKMGFVFQTFNLLPYLNARENVELPMEGKGKSKAEQRKRASELLAMVGLSGREGHRPQRLSAGEQQRVAIARALANNPAFILADEPTGNLDSQNKAETAFAKAKAAVDAANLTGTVLLDAQRLLDDAEHNIRLVKLGHGVHNVNYSTALLSVAVERCGTVMDSLAQRPPK